MKNDKNNNQPSETVPKRKYVDDASKAVSHPVRAQILKALKEGAMTAMDLNKITGESRYNLYYHLTALEDVRLVRTTPVNGKTKLYELNVPSKPEVAVLLFSEDEIRSHPKEFTNLLAAAGKIEGTAIPHQSKIVRAEVCFYYDWDQD